MTALGLMAYSTETYASSPYSDGLHAGEPTVELPSTSHKMTEDTPSSQPNYKVTILLHDTLAAETQAVVWLLRNRPDQRSSVTRAVNLLHDAVQVNLDHYFIEPARQLKIGPLGLRMLQMGTNTILKVIPSIGHKLGPRLSAEQLHFIADFIEEQLLET